MLPMNAERLVEQMAPYVHAVRIDRMHDLARALPVYERANLLDCATDAFFARTEQILRSGFTARGVLLDDRDDLVADLASLAWRGSELT